MTKKTITYSDFNIDIYKSIHEADVNRQWSSFKNDFLSSNYLKVLESSNPSDLQFRYLVVTNQKQEVCGIVYFQILKFSGKNLHLAKNPLFCYGLDILLKVCSFKLLICGNVFAVNFKPYCYDSNLISESDIFRIVEQFTETEKTAAVLLKDFGTDPSNEQLRSLGYKNYESDLTMCLDLFPDWKSIDDYRRALTKKYRRRFEKIYSTKGSLVTRELSLPEIQNLSDQLFELFKQVSEKQTISMGLIGKNYFEEFKISFPDKFKVIGYFLNEELIAFCTYIDRGELLEVHYIGLNYSLNEKYNLYFNILFDSVNLAIEEKKKQLELGRTAREAKANLGCKAVYFNDYIKLNNRMAVLAADWLGKNFQQSMGQEWQKRNPFKNVPSTE